MKKMPIVLKDGLVGLGIGIGAIIPGISGATVALVFGCFKKIVNAVSGLLSKEFLKNLLILLPFGVGCLVSFLGLIKPFQLAFEHCMFAIVCLFAALIIGSYPGLIDNVRGKQIKPLNIVVFIIGFAVAAMIGVTSILTKSNETIVALFEERPFYLYLILVAIGAVAASGLTVPGFSASMLLLALGFYVPIINLFHFDFIKEYPGAFFGLIGSFMGGIVIGFFLLSYLMSFLLKNHPQNTHYTILGFVAGSLVAIFVNSQMFDYLANKANILDWILTPIFVISGVAVAYLFVRFSRKQQALEEENA